MNYINDVREIVGHTPIIKLNNLGINENVNIFAKLENLNPGGSVKDRVGLYIIDGAEKRGELTKGATIICATAGNTGIGMALAAINKGYKIIFTVPTKFSEEKQQLMRALGAQIINTPREQGMLGAVKKAEELKETIKGSVIINQFENKDNPRAHYEGTGREIYEALDGKSDYFTAGAGSGATYSGIMKYFKERNKNIRGVLADPIGSTMGGGEEAPYNIEGIGNDFIPGTMDMKLVDDVIKVTDDEAFKAVKLLARKEGIIVGSSSGAALVSALKIAERIQEGNIVTVFPDNGDRYLSKGIYNDADSVTN